MMTFDPIAIVLDGQHDDVWELVEVYLHESALQRYGAVVATVSRDLVSDGNKRLEVCDLCGELGPLHDFRLRLRRRSVPRKLDLHIDV